MTDNPDENGQFPAGLPSEAEMQTLIQMIGSGRFGDVISFGGELAERFPKAAVVHNIMGGAYSQTKQFDEAKACFEKAIEADPNYAQARMNLGNWYHLQDMHEEAIVEFRAAVALNPDLIDGHFNLALSLAKTGEIELAERTYKEVLSRNSDHRMANFFLGKIYEAKAMVEEALHYFDAALKSDPSTYDLHSNRAMILNYSEKFDPATVYRIHRDFNAAVPGRDVASPYVPIAHRNPERRIKVGYVSPDFRNHSVAQFFEPLLKAHDRARFEIYCVYNHDGTDEVTERLKHSADHWREVAGQDKSAICEQIINDEIDILVDMAGHTGEGLLDVFARKPAPVQVTWLGYPNTTGLDEMDYRLVDEITDPTGDTDAFNSESLVRLPHGFLCYQGLESVQPEIEPAFSKNGYITFVSFNNTTKLSPKTIELWARILHEVPDSRLLLKAFSLNAEANRLQWINKFVDLGVAPERIMVGSALPSRETHLSLYNNVDIGLDPFPYNGTTTTCEAFWMGVPVVALRGNSHVSRVGASLLTRVGLENLIAEDHDQYVAIARALAEDHGRLREIKKTLRPRMEASDLCNGLQFARDIEQAFLQMWERKVSEET